MSTELQQSLADSLKEILTAEGFRLRGNTFRRTLGDVIQVIELQRSSRSSPSQLVVTINVGVYSVTLAQKMGRATHQPSTPLCHWIERIGLLSHVRRDQWWSISDAGTLSKATAEIQSLLREHGLPTLRGLASTTALIHLWESGHSPGLTDVQRERYLSFLGR